VKTLICLLSATTLWSVTLVKDGKSEYSICLEAQPSAADRHAAGELQRFIEEMSGARLPLTDSCDVRQPHIYVGAHPGLAGLTSDSFGPEEFVLKTAGSHIVVAGGRPRGTLYGVYTLLDRLGCRWYTADVGRIPKRSTLEIATLDERGRPAFEYREPYFTEALDKDWAARNRTNGAFSRLDESTGGKVEYYPFVHSFYSLLPPD